MSANKARNCCLYSRYIVSSSAYMSAHFRDREFRESPEQFRARNDADGKRGGTVQLAIRKISSLRICEKTTSSLEIKEIICGNSNPIWGAFWAGPIRPLQCARFNCTAFATHTTRVCKAAIAPASSSIAKIPSSAAIVESSRASNYFRNHCRAAVCAVYM